MTDVNGAYKTATLSMIAKAAGVSIATASRVLNRNDAVIPISARTKENVLKTARATGLLPSMAARALRWVRQKQLVCWDNRPISSRLGDPSNRYPSFVGEIMGGLFKASTARSYNLMMLTGAAGRTGSEMELLASFGMVDGMLVLNRDLAADDMVAHALESYPKPLAYVLTIATMRDSSPRPTILRVENWRRLSC